MLKTPVIFALAILFSCNNQEAKVHSDEHSLASNENIAASFSPVTEVVSNATDTSSTSAAKPHHSKKIIRNAELRFQVSDIDSASENIELLTRKYEGYISSSNLNSTYDNLENEIIIKVPSENFDDILQEIKHIAIFLNNRSIKSNDVTAEYVDLQSRLKTKYEVKQRYEEILRLKSKTVEEVLATEKQIGVLQEEIESSEGRLKYLVNQVSYSTIHLNCYQQITVMQQPLTAKHNLWVDIADRFTRGWEVLKSILLLLISIWPLLIAGTLAYILLRKKLGMKRFTAAPR